MGNKQIRVRTYPRGSHILNPHKTVVVTGIASFSRNIIASENSHLKNSYNTFCGLVDWLGKRYLSCVPTQVDALADFIVELLQRAFYSLVPDTYSIGGILAPVFFFARCDHLTPAAFVASLDAETLAQYGRILHGCFNGDDDVVGQHSVVWRIACERVVTEAYLHRPIAELFWGGADAR